MQDVKVFESQVRKKLPSDQESCIGLLYEQEKKVPGY